MADVSVNIRGRDDGVGNMLDSLRAKAAAVGVDVNRLNNLSYQSPRQQTSAITGVSNDTLRAMRQSVIGDYSDIRSNRNAERADKFAEFNDGKISKNDFDRYKKRFDADEKDLNKQEKEELAQLDKESNTTLRSILRELQEQRKTEQEKAQQDSKEFTEGGLIGALNAENRTLRNKQYGAKSEEEVAELQSQIDANNAKIRSYRKGDSDDDEDSEKKRGGVNGFIGAASSAGQGDLVGTLRQTPNVMRDSGAGAGTLAVAGGIVASLYGLYSFLKQDEKLLEETAPLASMRSISNRAGSSNAAYRNSSNIDPDGLNADLGIEHSQMINLMYQKAISSGIGGANLRTRALEDEIFKKGFGGDVSQFSEFERFGGGNSSKIGLDILNVLTSIHQSSLKTNDLVTLSEKLQSGQTIMSLQRQKRDLTDPDTVLKVMAAFESVGLSGKGNKSANFLSQTIEGLGEGGSDNLMMLKYEAAKRANPNLSNNPAALRRAVKFNSDDPNYMNEMFKMIGEITGGNEMATDDILYALFPGLNQKDMEIYKKSIKSGNFQDLLKGKGLNSMKQRKIGLSGADALEDAKSGTGTFTQSIGDFKNLVTELSNKFSGLLGMNGAAVNVAVVADKTKPKTRQNSEIVTNSTRPK